MVVLTSRYQRSINILAWISGSGESKLQTVILELKNEIPIFNFGLEVYVATMKTH